MKTTLLVLITTAAFASPAYALNRCVDAAGKVNYTDLPCDAGQKSGAVNLTGMGKSDRPEQPHDAEKFTTSSRTAAIQAYLAKTEAERAAEKQAAAQGKESAGVNLANLPGKGNQNLTGEMQKELARLQKELAAAKSVANEKTKGKQQR